MKLTVENISVVEKAEITLNNITVIAGYNGTGKSSIARALYGVLLTSNNIREKIKAERIKSVRYSLEKDFIIYLDDVEHNQNILNSLFTLKELVCDCLEKNCLKQISRQEYLQMFSRLDLNAKVNERDVWEIVERTVDNVLRRTDESYRSFITQKLLNRIYNGQIKNIMAINDAVISFMGDKDSKYVRINIKDEDNIRSTGDIKNMYSNVMYIEPKHIFDEWDGKNYFFSGDKKNKELLELLKVENKQSEHYTFEEFEEIKESSNVINQILNDTIKGQLICKNDTFYYKEANLDTPIEISNVASGLKNLLLIQRLIKNGSLRSGDVLMIDEPEVNLHPKWQVVFAEVLVLLNKKLNIKILLNSHSPYFIRAIECKMAQYETLNEAKFYLMKNGNKNGFIAKDVTDNIEEIYKDLYEPLEEL